MLFKTTSKKRGCKSLCTMEKKIENCFTAEIIDRGCHTTSGNLGLDNRVVDKLNHDIYPKKLCREANMPQKLALCVFR
jgi:hypothetical protein